MPRRMTNPMIIRPKFSVSDPHVNKQQHSDGEMSQSVPTNISAMRNQLSSKTLLDRFKHGSPSTDSNSPGGTSPDRRSSPNPHSSPPLAPGPLQPLSSPPWKGSSARPWAHSPRKKWLVPDEQVQGWIRTRTRIIEAVYPIITLSGDMAHEALRVTVQVLPAVPIPGLAGVAQLLLDIWDNIQAVDSNRMACLRLADRCAEILIAIREELAKLGDTAQVELQIPMRKVRETFFEIFQFLQRHRRQPFLKRYLKRDDMLRDIDNCNQMLTDCLNHFDRSVLLRMYDRILDLSTSSPRLTGAKSLLLSPGSSPTLDPLDDLALGTSFLVADSVKEPRTLSDDQIRANLYKIHTEQNHRDRAHDIHDIRSLLQMALEADNDHDMIRVLQVGTAEMPEAIKALLRALEWQGLSPPIEPSESSLASPSTLLRRASTWPDDQSRNSKFDLLEREFMERGLLALKRQMKGPPVELPSWTITKFELDLGPIVGRGLFSTVYKATWRRRAVAVKVLSAHVSRSAFINEVNIWKMLKHDNVLELLGASSTEGAVPWFLVSPFMKNGTLSDYLKRYAWDRGSYRETIAMLLKMDCLKMMHDIVCGMAHLHEHRILHGDMRAANILVNDGGACLVADFGQSKFRAQVVHSDPIPTHALRWQAPELLAKRSLVTKAADVYAFAITCVEILTIGGFPWPDLHDDAVRKRVMKLNERPPYPNDASAILGLESLIRAAWDSVPDNRPSFRQLSQTFGQLRGIFSTAANYDPTSERQRQRTLSNPINHANVLFEFQPPSETGSTVASTDDHWYDADSSEAFLDPFSIQAISPRSEATTIAEDHVGESIDHQPFDAQNELIYRLYLTHEFDPSLTLPLWTPSVVELGDIGYLSKPSGTFIKLCNAKDPAGSSNGRLANAYPLSALGPDGIVQESFHKRSRSQRGLDSITKMFSHGSPRSTSPHMRQLLPLTAPRSAFLVTDDSKHMYYENIRTCKQWFRRYWNVVAGVYAEEHFLQKEDLLMVVETISAANFALVVNHQVQNLDLQFDVFAAAPTGTPWGSFAPPPEIASADHMRPSYVTKISNVGDAPKTLLIGRLRFQPDMLEPTLL